MGVHRWASRQVDLLSPPHYDDHAPQARWKERVTKVSSRIHIKNLRILLYHNFLHM
jgi:hypothetical protein